MRPHLGRRLSAQRLHHLPGGRPSISITRASLVSTDRHPTAALFSQGADPEHLFFLKQFVNPKSGAAARNDTSNLQHVMTPRPYALRHVRVPVLLEAARRARM